MCWFFTGFIAKVLAFVHTLHFNVINGRHSLLLAFPWFLTIPGLLIVLGRCLSQNVVTHFLDFWSQVWSSDLGQVETTSGANCLAA